MKYQPTKISISLPEVLSSALQVEDFDKEYVGHSVNGKPAGKLEKPLEEGQYAFYIGKIFKNNRGVYTEEFLEGVINYARRNVAEGVRIKLVLCQILSELFNGEGDLEGTRSFEESKKFIEKIAKRRFDLTPDKLDIVELGEMSEHAELFALIKNAAKTGISLDTAFAQTKEVKTGSSIHLAKVLYDASQKSEVFQQMLQSTIPPRLRTGNNGEMANRRNYALIEIAVRLSEVLNGCTIHGGIDRQGVYDEIIEKIVKGSKVILTEIPELAAIYEQLKGKKFETLHLAADKNPYEVISARTNAIRKIVGSVLLAASAAVGIFEYGQHREKQAEKARMEAREQQAKRVINEKLKGASFKHGYIDSWVFAMQDDDQRAKLIDSLNLRDERLTEAVLRLADSYVFALTIYTDLPEKFVKDGLRNYLIDYFLANRDALAAELSGGDYGQTMRLARMIKFLQDHQLVLIQAGHDNWLFKGNVLGSQNIEDYAQFIPLLPYHEKESLRYLNFDFIHNKMGEEFEPKHDDIIRPLGNIHLENRELIVEEVNGLFMAREKGSKKYSQKLTLELLHVLYK